MRWTALRLSTLPTFSFVFFFVRDIFNRLVEFRIGYGETGLWEQVKAAGGRWDPEKKLWELPYAEAAKLRLLERIVEE